MHWMKGGEGVKRNTRKMREIDPYCKMLRNKRD
jgi:hypothetical protein